MSSAQDLFIKQIFSSVAPYLDLLSSGFSFGLDRFWRKQAVSRSGIGEEERVLDVCTGTGELALLVARKVGPRGSVIGADFCESMLERARTKAAPHENVSFILTDAKDLCFPDNSFDAVTAAFGLRNIPDTTIALREMNRVLKTGGRFICLELTRPRSPWFRTFYEWYVFRVMPFIGQLVVKTAGPYRYLPRSINAFYSSDEFKQVIAENGFTDVTVYTMTMGIATLYRAVKHG